MGKSKPGTVQPQVEKGEAERAEHAIGMAKQGHGGQGAGGENGAGQIALAPDEINSQGGEVTERADHIGPGIAGDHGEFIVERQQRGGAGGDGPVSFRQRQHEPVEDPDEKRPPQNGKQASAKQIDAEDLVPGSLKEQIERHLPVGIAVQAQIVGSGEFKDGGSHDPVANQVDGAGGEMGFIGAGPLGGGRERGEQGEEQQRGGQDATRREGGGEVHG